MELIGPTSDKYNSWFSGLKRHFSRGVSILTFPGFIAAAGFGLLSNGVHVSSDLMSPNEVITYIHFSGALFGYVLVPLIFVFGLLWQKKISRIEMPNLSDRKWGYLGAVAGAIQVFVMTWVDAPERAGRELKNLLKYVDTDTGNKLQSVYLERSNDCMGVLIDEIQSYTLVVLMGLLLMYGFVWLGKKLSIHMCAAATVITQSFIGMFHLYDKIPVEQQFQKSFGLPWGGWGCDWQQPLMLGFLFYGGGLLALIYWARRAERAHTHAELLGGLVLGLLVPMVGLMM
jgi:hypothetical protein